MDADQSSSNPDQPISEDEARLNDQQTRDPLADRPHAGTRVDTDRSVNRTRVTVAQAAKLLGLSTEAIRSRVLRGTLNSVEGRRYGLRALRRRSNTVGGTTGQRRHYRPNGRPNRNPNYYAIGRPNASGNQP